VEVASLIERRRKLGQDLFDEVWEGVLHINPVPSGRHGKIDRRPAAVLEIVSPGDETDDELADSPSSGRMSWRSGSAGLSRPTRFAGH